MSIYHLRDLATKKKKQITTAEADIYKVPQYEGLDKEDMLQWAANNADVADALPDALQEREKLHRDYISTVIYTLCG